MLSLSNSGEILVGYTQSKIDIVCFFHRNDKFHVVARLISIDAEYSSMTLTTCKVTWFAAGAEPRINFGGAKPYKKVPVIHHILQKARIKTMLKHVIQAEIDDISSVKHVNDGIIIKIFNKFFLDVSNRVIVQKIILQIVP